jgi:pyridoxine kinase
MWSILVCHPCHPGVSPGDLLTALLLGWSARHPQDLATAVEKAVAGLQGVLLATAAAAGTQATAVRNDETAEVRAGGV